jgi:hypothetical protein
MGGLNEILLGSPGARGASAADSDRYPGFGGQGLDQYPDCP